MGIYGMRAPSCTCLGKDKSQKLSGVFSLKRHPRANMVPLRIASVRRQSSLCRTVKISRMTEERPEQTAAWSEAQENFKSTGLLHSLICTHPSFCPFPYLEYNKYVCICALSTEQSNQDMIVIQELIVV